MHIWLFLTLLPFFFSTGSLHAFETAKVLPKGRSAIIMKNMFSKARYKTGSFGQKLPLSEPMQIKLTYQRILDGESDPLKRKLLTSFLDAEGIGLEEDLGAYDGDFAMRLHVFAPVFLTGLTEKLSLLLVVPILDVSSAATISFKPHVQNQKRLFATMMSPKYNQQGGAHKTAKILSDARGEYGRKLEENGYKELSTFSGYGLSDVQVGGIYQLLKDKDLLLSTSFGLVLPTGKVDDPDNLGDIPFGDGQFDVFAKLSVDEPLFSGIFFNQFIQYTYQMAGKRKVRLSTERELITPDTKVARMKLGDKIDAGFSMQLEANNGMRAGLGFSYFKKWSDRFDVPKLVQKELAKESSMEYVLGEIKIGYNTLNAVLRGDFLVPLGVSFGYQKQYYSRHYPVMDFAVIDFEMYF